MTHLLRRAATATFVTTTLAVVAGAGLVSAHIEPDPAAVEAGVAATVAFGVEHGCEGSPTTELELRVPEGVTDAVPVDKEGWTTSVDGDVVTFADGSLDPETPDTFSISFTAPATPGPIHFPVVQTCETGSIAWIEIAEEGQPEPDDPAPTVLVTDGPPTAADLAPDEDDAAEAEGVTATTTSTTSAPDDDGSSNTGVVIAIFIAVAIVGAGAALVVRRRSTDRPDGTG